MFPTRATLLAACLSALVFCGPAHAEIAPPTAAPIIEITEYGIYCRPQTVSRSEAPETTLGYVDVFEGSPEFRYRQQEVPARIGVSFGVEVMPATDILNVRIETWRPGAGVPDIWYTDFYADTITMRGFAFDFEEELILGRWRMEAWDNDTRLYSVEFEVVVPSALPAIGSDCIFLS